MELNTISFTTEENLYKNKPTCEELCYDLKLKWFDSCKKIEELKNQVKTLNEKIDELAADHQEMKELYEKMKTEIRKMKPKISRIKTAIFRNTPDEQRPYFNYV